MPFKLYMSAKKLFKNAKTELEKKEILIKYGRYLVKQFNRPLLAKDFTQKGRIRHTVIWKLFGNFTNFLIDCNLPINQRKPNMSDEEIKDFLLKIKEKTDKGCWVTSYYVNYPNDRTQFRYRGKHELIYRISYVVFKGAIPNNYLIRHMCDTPLCFNPDHLKIGTNRDNAIDRVKNSRMSSKKSKPRKKHFLKDPYDYASLLKFVKANCTVTEKNEWLFNGKFSDYPRIKITFNDQKRPYMLHRLILANKLKKKYDDIEIACHRLPDGSKPQKHDLNPDHLFDGSNRTNSLDAAEYSKSYKLNFEAVVQIKKDLKKTNFSKWGSKSTFDRKWANKFKVEPNTIGAIRLGKKWTHTKI